MAQTVIFLTQNDPRGWLVPLDWQDFNNSIECIGGGGGGCEGKPINPSTVTGSGGGQGGSYARKGNVALSPGSRIPYSVGEAGLHGNPASAGGGDTWFGAASFVDAIAAAAGGVGATVSGAAIIHDSDQTSVNIGDVSYKGGAGGPGVAGLGGGGGGAAGTTGAGVDAPNPFATGIGDASKGGDGNAHNGGAGGITTSTDTLRIPQAGGDGTEWTRTSNGESGGAGGGASGSTGFFGSVPGGRYGGGGGGGGQEFFLSSAHTLAGADGAPGIIVITYEPRSSIVGPNIR